MSGVWIGLYVLMWLTIATLSVAVLGLHRRLEAFETTTLGGTETNPQLKIDAGARPELVSTYKEHVPLGPPAVLVFANETCEHCANLAASLAGHSGALWRREGSPSLIFVVQGAPEPFYPANANSIVGDDGAMSRAFGVNRTPFAVAIDSDWVIRAAQVVNTAAQVADLISGVAPRAGSRAVLRDHVIGVETRPAEGV